MSKPRALEVIEDKVTTVTGQLEPRERALLVAAIIIIVVACVFTAFNFIYKSIDAQIAETEGYRRSLNFIAVNQSTYLANRAKKDAMPRNFATYRHDLSLRIDIERVQVHLDIRQIVVDLTRYPRKVRKRRALRNKAKPLAIGDFCFDLSIIQ